MFGNHLWKSVLEDPQESRTLPGTVRHCSAEETLARLKPLLPEFGITRLADVTGLDVLGLPVYQAIRPNSRNISVSQGKGATPVLAQVSALMEAVESFHAEEISGPVVTSSVGEIRQALDYDPRSLAVIAAGHPVQDRLLQYDPFALPVGRPSWLGDESVVEWVAAVRLSDGKNSWVPRQLCQLDFTVRHRWRPPFFRASSNGLASGNTVTEALIHGICECIERDCLARAVTRRNQAQAIDLKSIGAGVAEDALERFFRRSFKVVLFDITGPTGVPCFEAIARDRENRVSRGAGCHPDRSIAITRALLEAAQGRLAKIAGSRDDLYREMYLPVPGRKFAALFQTHALKPVSECAQLAPNVPALTLKDLTGRVEKYAGAAPLAVDLRRSYGIPVVFVVTPGLQFQAPARTGHFFLMPLPMLPGASSPALPGPAPAEQAQDGAKKARVCIFAGPSISRAEIMAGFQGQSVEVTCRPPVQQGDLLMLLSDPPDIVGIIDGYFMQTPSVTHKEILLLLERGTRVLGGGSMGALRAAELHVFGMEGAGTVYQWYRDGLIDGDDEVAMSHGDAQEEFRPFTEPLVNVRHCLEKARERRLIEEATAANLLQAAGALHFSERTWQAIWDSEQGRICDREEIDRLRDYQIKERPNLKHDDALLLVRKIAGLAAARERQPMPKPHRVPQTRFLHVLKRDYLGHIVRGHHVAAAAALSFYKLFSPGASGLFRRACNRLILSEAARGPEDSSPPTEGLIADFRRRQAIQTPRRFTEWLNLRGLDRDELQIYLEERHFAALALKAAKAANPAPRISVVYRSTIAAVCAHAGAGSRMSFCRYIAPGIASDEMLLIEMKMRREYYPFLNKAFCLLDEVFGQSKTSFQPHIVRPDHARLEKWCSQLWQVPMAEVRSEAERRGFLSYPELMQTATLAYLAEKRALAAHFSLFPEISSRTAQAV